MAKKTKADFDAKLAEIQATKQAKLDEEKAKIEKQEEELLLPAPHIQAKIVSMYPTYNENQIGAMLMIPKHIVELVLKHNG